MQRVPLAAIGANRRPKHQLSSENKHQIIGRSLAGQSHGLIARAERLPKSTVTSTLCKVIKRRNTNILPRSGRPREYSETDVYSVLRYARNNPIFTYRELIRESGFTKSTSTCKRILEEHGIINWRAKKRPHLTQTQATLRLNFARSHINTDWSRVLFSDECSVEKGKGKKQRWAFGYWHQKWDHDKIVTYPKGKQGSVMVWASIGGTEKRSELIIMARDEDSPRGGFSSYSYTDTLEEGLLPIYNGEQFVQDNAPIHTSNWTLSWIAQNGIFLLPMWPPYSPDLNPIEHIWYHLKARIYELRPDIDAVTNKERQKEILCDTLPQAWNDIRASIIDKCVESMPDRIQAVINANGWQTKY